MNEQIFKLLGWETRPDGKRWKSEYCKAYYKYRKLNCHGGHWYENKVPMYDRDLGLVINAEQQLGLHEDQEWIEILINIVLWDKRIDFDKSNVYDWAALCASATAEQRCEAILTKFNIKL